MIINPLSFFILFSHDVCYHAWLFHSFSLNLAFKVHPSNPFISLIVTCALPSHHVYLSTCLANAILFGFTMSILSKVSFTTPQMSTSVHPCMEESPLLEPVYGQPNCNLSDYMSLAVLGQAGLNDIASRPEGDDIR